jgi:hypothetical protein
MRILLSAGLACVVAACGLSIASRADAATAAGINFATGSVCQLSIPTIDTKFRPKATGARNESTTTSNFVICPMPSGVPAAADAFSFAMIAVYSIDGASHEVSCTAVTGRNGQGIAYATKAFSVSAEDGDQGVVIPWSAADFGGVEGDPIAGSQGFSVTCLLPPQTAINAIQGSFDYEIGA